MAALGVVGANAQAALALVVVSHAIQFVVVTGCASSFSRANSSRRAICAPRSPPNKHREIASVRELASLSVLFHQPCSAVLLLLVINSMRGEADQLKDALGSADWRLLIPAIALYFLGVLLRSVRWGMLLPEYGLKLWTLFRALVVGFTVNNLLPFRMGEVARAYLLARWGSVPYGATVASLVVERVLDGLSLSLLLLVALWLVPSAPSYLLAVGVIAGCGFFIGLALVALAAWRADALTMFVGFFARRMPPRLGPRLIGAANNFARSGRRRPRHRHAWRASLGCHWWRGAASWACSTS